MHRLKCDSVIPFTPLCETAPPSFDKSVLLWSRNKQPDFSGSEMMLFTAWSHFASVSISASGDVAFLFRAASSFSSLLNWFHGTDFTVSYQLWKLMAAPFGKAAWNKDKGMSGVKFMMSCLRRHLRHSVLLSSFYARHANTAQTLLFWSASLAHLQSALNFSAGPFSLNVIWSPTINCPFSPSVPP